MRSPRNLAILLLIAGLALTAGTAVSTNSLSRFTDSQAVGSNILSTASWTKVQSGTASSGGNGTTTVNISSVDPTKAFLIFQTRHNLNRPVAAEIRGRILDATNLEFVRVTDETSTVNIQWYVVEHPRISVQRGQVTQSAAIMGVSITPVNSLSQAFVTWSKTPNSGDNNFENNDPILAELTSTSNLEFRADAANAGHTIWWQVIEFTNAADVNVQRGTTSLTGTTLSTTATLGTSVDTTKTFVLTGYRSAETGTGADVGAQMLRAQLTNSTTLTFDRGASGPGVSRISSWTTGLTHTAGAGSNRLLLFAVGYENSADPGISTITYGGQTMTRIAGAVAGTTTVARQELWYLNEAGIAAATGTTFSVTWGGTAPSNPMYAAASYQNVNQSSPIYNSSTNFTSAATPNPITTTVNVVNGSMAVGGVIDGNGGSYTWNNSWTEGTDQQSGATTTMSSADHTEPADGTDTASATHSGSNRQAIVAATLSPVTTTMSEIAWQAVELKDGSTVQRGSQYFGSGTSQQTPSISAVNTGRSIAFASVQPVGGQNMGKTPYVSDDIVGVCSVTIAISSSTQLTMDRNNTASTCDVGWFVIDFSAATALPVTRVNSWTTGLTHTAGSGSNRLLVFAVGYENGADPGISTITYGGQTLTRIAGTVAGTTTVDRQELWYLNEAGIAAASGNTFSVTWGGTAPANPMYAAVTFKNVSQITPINTSGTNSTDTATPNPITATINVVDRSMTVSGAISGNNGSYTWNNGWTEGTDQTSGSTTNMSTADHAISGNGTDTASATHSGPNRQAIVAADLNQG